MLSLIKTFTTTNIALPTLTVIQRAADSIQAVDESANLRVQDDTITWLSADLLESVTITFIELNDTTCVWGEHLECDAPIVAAAFQHLEASLNHQADTEEAASSIHEATLRLLAASTFNRLVEVTKHALKGAADSPFRSVGRFAEVLSVLPAFTHELITRRGVSPDTIAEELGLGSTFRNGISAQARTKYRSEHEFLHNGRKVLSQFHWTIGGSCNDAVCCSIHAYFDASQSRLVILHIGKHTRSAGTRT
jgi:hypothetical protein